MTEIKKERTRREHGENTRDEEE
jgi:hypothetical protein